MECTCYIDEESCEGAQLVKCPLCKSAPDLYEALKEISLGKGKYSLDKLTHASNTIEDMKELALEALAKADSIIKED